MALNDAIILETVVSLNETGNRPRWTSSVVRNIASMAHRTWFHQAPEGQGVEVLKRRLQRLRCSIFLALLTLPLPAYSAGVWDGVYVGPMNYVVERSTGRACGGGWTKQITVHNNVFIFPYNPTEGVSIPASIDVNGVVTGYTSSARAGARIEAQIASGVMTGKIFGQWCTYTIQLSRRDLK